MLLMILNTFVMSPLLQSLYHLNIYIPVLTYISLNNANITTSVSLRREYPSSLASFALIPIDLDLSNNMGIRAVQHNVDTVSPFQNTTLI